MFGCTHEAKYAAYKAIIRPTIEYAAVVWNPHNHGDIKLLESLQNRAACWICGSRWCPLGLFPAMIAAPNCASLLSSRDEISFLLASSVTCTTSKHPSLLIITAHSIPLCPPEDITFHLSLHSPPLTLGDILFL